MLHTYKSLPNFRYCVIGDIIFSTGDAFLTHLMSSLIHFSVPQTESRRLKRKWRRFQRHPSQGRRKRKQERWKRRRRRLQCGRYPLARIRSYQTEKGDSNCNNEVDNNEENIACVNKVSTDDKDDKTEDTKIKTTPLWYVYGEVEVYFVYVTKTITKKVMQPTIVTKTQKISIWRSSVQCPSECRWCVWKNVLNRLVVDRYVVVFKEYWEYIGFTGKRQSGLHLEAGDTGWEGPL